MKAAYLVEPRKIEMRDIPTPRITPDQVLVRVRSIGICGSDIHYFLDGRIGDTTMTEPLLMGHEFAGEVAEIGSAVTGLHVGQRVAVEPAIACGHCEMCLEGHPNLCLNIRFMATPPDQGALCEYVAAEAARCFPLPNGMDCDDGAMLEPFGVALHTMRLAKMLIGDTVGIVGCGPIGLSVLQLVNASGGLNIVATEKLDYRLEYAKRFGASLMVNVNRTNPEAAVKEFTHGRGLDIVVEAAGSAEAPDQALRMVRNGGLILLVGIPKENEFTLTASISRRKGVTYKMVRRMKHTYPRAIALAQASKVDLRSMVTHHFPLEQTAEAFELVAASRDGVIKAMITV